MGRFEVVLRGEEFRDAFLDLMAMRFPAEAVDRKRRAWAWLFSGPFAAAGRTTQVFTIERQGRLAGAFLFIPCEYVIDGRPSPAMHPVATAAHPDFVGVGPLMLHAQLHVAETLAVGIPNRLRLSKAYTRYGALLGPGRTLRRRIHRPGAMLARRGMLSNALGSALDVVAWGPLATTGLLRPSLTRDERVDRIDRFGPEFDEAWAAAEGTIAFAQKRSAAFLTWRYRDMPLQRYEALALRRGGRLAGYTITSVQEAASGKAGRIVDVFVYDGAIRDYAALLAAADARLRAAGCVASEFSFVDNPALDAAARKLGFLWRKDALPLVMRHDRPPVHAALPALGARMHFCRGDHDEDY